MRKMVRMKFIAIMCARTEKQKNAMIIFNTFSLRRFVCRFLCFLILASKLVDISLLARSRGPLNDFVYGAPPAIYLLNS